MKRKKIIGLVFYILGLAVGSLLLFPIVGTYQISYIFGFFGLAISALSLIYGHIIMNIESAKIGNAITSKLTPLFRFYIPILILELFLSNTILLVFNIYPNIDIGIFIILEVILTLWLLVLNPCFRLSQIYLRKGKIIAYNFFKSKEFNEKEVKNIKRYYVFFYKVKLDKISIIALPKFSESVNLFVTPKSIRGLRR